MRMSDGFTVIFLLIFISYPVHCNSLLASGSEKPPTISEAIQLLQLDTIRQLKETIKAKEDANGELERRIVILEEENMENLNQSEQQKTRMKEDLEIKMVGMQEEIIQMKEELKLKLDKAQMKCQEEKDTLDQEHTEALSDMKNNFKKSQSIVEYMSDILLHSHEMIEERQKLIKTHEKVIKEKNKEREIYKNITTKQLTVNEKALQTISLQEENNNLLKASLSSASKLSKLSTKDLDNVSIAPFMVELMESYNEQMVMVENLRTVLEKDNEIETQISEMILEIANTSSTSNLINKNWDTIEQQATMIQMQSKTINLLKPLLGFNPNKTDIIWFNKAEDGAIIEASTCGCLPRPPQPSTLKPAQIEYQCERHGNRSYSLACESGVCGTEKLPSCEEPVIWEEVDVTYEECQEISFNNNTLLCGQGWREENKTSGAIGAGIWKELVKTPCSDCGDLSTALDWQPWGLCTDADGEDNVDSNLKQDLDLDIFANQFEKFGQIDHYLDVYANQFDKPDKICRRRGNDKIGFQEEEKGFCGISECTSSEGCTLVKNKLLTTLTKLDKEFSISFEFKATKYMSGWQSVIHFTESYNSHYIGDRGRGLWFQESRRRNGNRDGDCCNIGNRVPGFYVKDSGRLYPRFAVNGDGDYGILTTKEYPLNQWHHVEFSQALENNKYVYRVKFNGITEIEVENRQAKMFSNVKVYTADPWYNSLKGSLRNLFISTEGSNKCGDAGCPVGEEYNGNCYLLVETPKTWLNAAKDCTARGGVLASINNAGANAFIAKLSGKTGSVTSTWIGASDATTEGVWKWTNGESVTFTNWSESQPDNYAGNQDCAAINFKSIGKWDDGTCTTQLPYICQGVKLKNKTSG